MTPAHEKVFDVVAVMGMTGRNLPCRISVDQTKLYSPLEEDVFVMNFFSRVIQLVSERSMCGSQIVARPYNGMLLTSVNYSVTELYYC